MPYISLMTISTTGGVFALVAALGDVNIAEPKALIGFAGARVAAGTIAEEPPEGFQRAKSCSNTASSTWSYHARSCAETLQGSLALPARGAARQDERQRDRSNGRSPQMLDSLVNREPIHGRRGPDRSGRGQPRRAARRCVGNCVRMARNVKRPHTLEPDQGDGHGRDRAARRSAVPATTRRGRRLLPHRRLVRRVRRPSKGRRDGREHPANFGMPHPEGYRKAIRLYRLAERGSRRS